MEYRYNEERNRIMSHANNPAFYKVLYESIEGEQRQFYFYSHTVHSKRAEAIAKSYAKNESEMILNIHQVPQVEYELWLGARKKNEDGKLTEGIMVYDTLIPADYIVRFLITEAAPTATYRPGKVGDLSEYQKLLKEKNPMLLEKLSYSYELSLPHNDIVRIAPDVEYVEVRSKEEIEKTKKEKNKEDCIER